MSRGDIKIFACRAGKPFAKRIISELNKILESTGRIVNLGKSKSVSFADGEIKTVIKDSVRGKDVYLVQSFINTNDLSVNDNIMEFLLAANALKRSGPSHINSIIPYLAYSRQDKPKDREPVSASLLAETIERAGIEGIITMDVHSDQIAGFYKNIGFDNLRASMTLINYFKKHKSLDDVVVISPDAGGAKRAKFYAKKLKTDMAIMHKNRNYEKENVVEKTSLLGDVKEKQALIVDDIVDTGGSLVNTIEELYKNNVKTVSVVCTHALLNNHAKEKLDRLYQEGKLEYLAATDTIIQKNNPKWLKEVPVSGLFAQVINNMNMDLSVSELYEQ